MHCEACGDPVSYSSAHRANGDFVCKSCYASRENKAVAVKPPPRRRAGTGGSQEATQPSVEEPPVELASNNFKTLLWLGELISGVGWIAVLIGGVGLLFGFSELSESTSMGMGDLLVLVSSAIPVALGLLLAAVGQLISCFVAIEHNTRSVFELLKTRAS